MKVAILTNMAPYIFGGAEVLAEDLKNKLCVYGHEAQVIRFHFSWKKNSHLLDAMFAAHMTKIENVDCVIGMKFPAYLCEHHNKKIWLIHQFRQAYDLENTEFDCFTSSKEDQAIKASIRQSDIRSFDSVGSSIYTISPVVSERLSRYCGIASEPLLPPLSDDSHFYCERDEGYIYLPSRVNKSKRQAMLVEAMRYTKTNVKLLLTGKGDTKQDEDSIFRLIEKYNLSNKVIFLNRFISEKEKYDFYSRSIMVAFTPVYEDYGYVTLEAFSSKKPVLSCQDSGCPTYFISNQENGFITAPDPYQIAEKFDYAYTHRTKMTEMGMSAYNNYLKMDITWDRVIRRLIG